MLNRLRLRLRYWFYDHFGERYTEKCYQGHGNFTETNGWMFRGRFVPVDPDREE